MATSHEVIVSTLIESNVAIITTEINACRVNSLDTFVIRAQQPRTFTLQHVFVDFDKDAQIPPKLQMILNFADLPESEQSAAVDFVANFTKKNNTYSFIPDKESPILLKKGFLRMKCIITNADNVKLAEGSTAKPELNGQLSIYGEVSIDRNEANAELENFVRLTNGCPFHTTGDDSARGESDPFTDLRMRRMLRRRGIAEEREFLNPKESESSYDDIVKKHLNQGSLLLQRCAYRNGEPNTLFISLRKQIQDIADIVKNHHEFDDGILIALIAALNAAVNDAEKKTATANVALQICNKNAQTPKDAINPHPSIAPEKQAFDVAEYMVRATLQPDSDAKSASAINNTAALPTGDKKAPIFDDATRLRPFDVPENQEFDYKGHLFKIGFQPDPQSAPTTNNTTAAAPPQVDTTDSDVKIDEARLMENLSEAKRGDPEYDQ
ncbi:MAG: hypothetical protein M0R33_18790 [Methylomonas sp.]|jgi:hypothetical protein|uniref:hypothetical protein n=1 Tax=Methylomonas sp. TaxID=418 RepID=UPI0025EF5FEB|nr:hypothetical protein [Methylomonas sp.]MCK9608492.1 hypothetical protein [Methylomonas sp.]